MITIRHTTLILTLATALALPTLVRAEEAAPAAPAPEAIADIPATVAAPMPGMGPGMGMRRGAMHGEGCNMNKGGRMGDGKPCMMGDRKGCGMGDGAGMTDKRLDMLEKRMDMMQMMLEMMMKQPADSNP